MTPDLKSKIEKWNATAATIEGYVNSCPDLTDIDWLLKWYGEIHTHLMYLGNEKALAHAEFAEKCAADLKADAIPPNVWQYIKGSSTSLERYQIGTNSELYAAWQRLENLAKVMDRILANMQTLLVTLRQTEGRDNRTVKDQGSDERKNGNTDYLFPER